MTILSNTGHDLRRLLPLCGLLALLACFACESKSKPPPVATGAHGSETDAGAPPSTVGTSCVPKGGPRGTCPEGYLCYPSAPGGYCTAFCSFAGCSDGDAVCLQSPMIGEICARRCRSDSDCRKTEGHVCDGQRGACVWPGMLLSPVLKTCSGKAPPRRTFGKATQLSTAAGPGRYNTEVTAARNAAGDLVAIYMSPGLVFEPLPLGVSTLRANGTVAGDRTITGLRKQTFDPWLAADRSGRLYLAYYSHAGRDADGVIGLTTSEDGITWSEHRVVHDLKDCPAGARGCLDKSMVAIGPRIGVGALGKDSIYIFYFAREGMRVVRSDDGGKTFSRSFPVGAGAYGDAEVASDGSLHVVYVTSSAAGKEGRFGSPKNRIEYVRSTNGGKTFSKPRTVSAPGESVPFYFSNAQVAYNPKLRRVHVAYPAGTPDGVWDLYLASSRDRGASWRRIKVNDDDRCANHMTPTIVAERATGRLHVAWLENRGGSGRAAYASCSADGATCTPNESISTAFASYALVRHSPKWPGEYFSLLLDEPGKALHAVWVQTVIEKGRPVGRVFHAGAAIAHTAMAGKPWQGKVSRAPSGDTLTVQDRKVLVTVRLHGVDCPELGQPFGEKARRFTSKRVSGKIVTIEPMSEYRSGRVTARVHYPVTWHVDSRRPEKVPGPKSCLNDELLQAGLAWWHRKNAPLPMHKKLAKLEAEAKRAKRGLWKDKDPKAPWLWQAQYPPKLPWSKNRVCKRDSDCALLPRICPGCPPCEPTWRTPGNQKALKQIQKIQAKVRCRPHRCRPCSGSGSWLGTRAVCRKGQCSVKP